MSPSVFNKGGAASRARAAAALKPCPQSPNCVSSLATAKHQYIPPLKGREKGQDMWARLEKVLSRMDGVKWQTVAPGHIQAVFTTKWLRFKDDAQFFWEPSEQVIHVRSASRRGYSDLGANRRRIEQIRGRLNALTP